MQGAELLLESLALAIKYYVIVFIIIIIIITIIRFHISIIVIISSSSSSSSSIIIQIIQGASCTGPGLCRQESAWHVFQNCTT